jgi:general secretion pathway protein J
MDALRPPFGPPALSHQGFTLVEVLVALMVLSLMASMAWKGVDSLIRTREVAQKRMESLLRAQAVMAQWEADLQAVVGTQVSPGLSCQGASLHLTRRHADGVQVVTWGLRSGELSRWTAPPTTRSEALQLAWDQSFQLLGNEAEQLRTLQGVGQMQVFFYRGNAWSNCQSTGDVAAPPPPANPSQPPPPGAGGKETLPDGVRLVLTFADGGTLAGTVIRDVRLAP